MSSRRISIRKFQEHVWAHYEARGRHGLPWRKTKNPYRILVSEVMLQQTQVDRVIPKYCEFLKAFPTVHTLAEAPLSEVLRVWSGLGYNRRVMLLKRAAETIVAEYGSRIPREVEALEALPGVGSYTARALYCFAYNKPTVFIETNIRSVFIHFFCGHRVSTDSKVHDREIVPLVEATLDRVNPREWYYALMDYGVYLKKTVGNASRASAHYTRQSRFEGSRRQARGLIVKTLLLGGRTERQLQLIAERPAEDLSKILETLVREGSIRKTRGRYRLAS